ELQDSQDVGVSGQEEGRVAVEDLLVGLERAQELVELPVPAEGLPIDPHGLGVALGPGPLGFPVGLGRDAGLLALGLAHDLLRLPLAPGTQAPRALASLGLDWGEVVRTVLLRQI